MPFAQPRSGKTRTGLSPGSSPSLSRDVGRSLVNDTAKDPRATLIPGTAQVSEALIVAPLAGPAGIMGSLNLYRQGRQFSPAELDLARLYASQAAIALETAGDMADSPMRPVPMRSPVS